MSNKLFYRLGLEDLIENTPTDEPETLEEMAGEATPEADILAADQQGEQLEQDQKDADGIAADSETMGEVVEGLEAALKSGKPSAHAIAFANISINAVNKRWFGDKSLTVSAESITSPEEAIVASMEGAMDKVKELGRAFVEKLKKMWNTFTGWLKSIFDGSAKLGDRAKALLKKATDTKDTEITSETLKAIDHGTLKEIAVRGKVNSSTVKSGVTNLANLLIALEGTTVIATDMGEIGEKAIKGSEGAGLEGFKKLNEAFSNMPKQLGGAEPVKSADWAPEGAVVARAKNILPGDMALYVVYGSEDSPKDLTAAAKVFTKYKFAIKPAGGEPAEVGVDTIKVDDIKGLANTLVSVSNKIGEYKRAYAQREHLRGLVIKTLEDAAKEAAAENEGDKARIAKERSDFARAFGSAWSSLISADYMVLSYFTKTVKAYLAFGDKVLKGEAPAKKEEAEPKKAEEPKKEEAPKEEPKAE